MSFLIKEKNCCRLLVLFFLLIPTVHSLGISPAVQEIKFEPSLTESFQVQIFGEANPFDVKLTVSGDLERYITLPQESLTVPEEGITFEYEINLPPQFKPGKHKASIVIEQQPKISESGAGKSTFGARAAVGYLIVVNVPYENKYAEAVINVPNVNVGQPLNFIVTVNNYGNEDIQNAQGIIDVFDDKENKIITIDTDSSGIKQGKGVELYSHWTPKEVKPGIYEAKAVINYDGKQTKAETDFLIGDLFIDILDLNPKEIELDQIQKLNIDVKSFWSQKIEKIYATVDLFKDNEKQETISTPPINLEPWQTSSLTAFWDTTNYDPGEYSAKVILNYKDKTTLKNFKLIIKTPEKSFPYSVLVGVLIVIGLMIIFFIIIIIKKRSK